MDGDCRKCDNSGSVTCPSCKGEQRQECRKCHGTRYLGTKRRPCPRCEGDGYLQCKRCDDFGEIACNRCDRWILRHPAGAVIMNMRRQQENQQEQLSAREVAERKKVAHEALTKQRLEKAKEAEKNQQTQGSVSNGEHPSPGCLTLIVFCVGVVLLVVAENKGAAEASLDSFVKLLVIVGIIGLVMLLSHK